MNLVFSFFETLLERDSAYHDHKESMAWAGVAVYLVAFGSGVIGPRELFDGNERWAVILGVCASWFIALMYIRWQLLRRRWAAIRVQAIQELLAKWIENSSAPDAFERGQELNLRMKRWKRVLSYLIPQPEVLPKSDVNWKAYPKCFVENVQAVYDKCRNATRAYYHEVAIIVGGWLLFALLLYRVLRVP